MSTESPGATAGAIHPIESSSPFDDVAATYDGTFGRSPAGRHFRFRLAERIADTATPGTSLLDIGSGTGEDAAWLSARGFKITGIDPSPRMLAVAREKKRPWGNGADFQLTDLLAFQPSGPFDAVYSNFGVMNCVPLEAWVGALSKLVRPGGRAFLVLMGRRPLPEFLRAGPSAWKRRREPMAMVGSRSIAVTYPTPATIKAALRASFRIERTETLGVVVPGPGMDEWPRRHPILFGLCAAIERVLSRRRLLCGFSDHFLIELSRQ